MAISELHKKAPFDETYKLRPLMLLIIVVPQGQAGSIKKILDEYEVSAEFVTSGEGTLPNKTVDRLGMGDKKNIVFTIVRDDKAEEIKEKLHQRFSVSRASAGVAICVKLTSVAGVTMYKFLSNTRKVTKVSKHDKKR